MSRDEDREQVLRLFPIACAMDNRTFAKEVFGTGASFWAMVIGGEPIPDARMARVEADFRRRFSTFSFDRHHVNLPPREFVALFVNENIYQKLLDAIDEHRDKVPEFVPGPRPRPIPEPERTPVSPTPSEHPLKRFYGHYLGLYLCQDPGDPTKEAVGVDAFEIGADESNDPTVARVRQLTNSFSTLPSVGRLRLLWDTIEIEVAQGNSKDPDATFMAQDPRDDVIRTMLGIGTDIKFGKRRVVSRPTLSQGYDKTRFLRSLTRTPLVVPCTKRCDRSSANTSCLMQSDTSSHRKSALEEHDENMIVRAVKVLRQVSVTADPPGGLGF